MVIALMVCQLVLFFLLIGLFIWWIEELNNDWKEHQVAHQVAPIDLWHSRKAQLYTSASNYLRLLGNK